MDVLCVNNTFYLNLYKNPNQTKPNQYRMNDQPIICCNIFGLQLSFLFFFFFFVKIINVFLPMFLHFVCLFVCLFVYAYSNATSYDCLQTTQKLTTKIKSNTIHNTTRNASHSCVFLNSIDASQTNCYNGSVKCATAKFTADIANGSTIETKNWHHQIKSAATGATTRFASR